MTEVAARAGFRATGLEISAGLIEHARKTYPQRRFVCSPLETFDAGSTQFDAVYCSEVIEHAIDPLRQCGDAQREPCPMAGSDPGRHPEADAS